MIRIRAEQEIAFRIAAQSAFIDDLFDYFQNLYPELYPLESASDFRARLHRIVQGVNRYKLTGYQAVLIFVWLTLTFGEGFERDPKRSWTQSILNSPNLPQDCKIAWLLRGLDCGLPTGTV
jgi:hypothetical protein